MTTTPNTPITAGLVRVSRQGRRKDSQFHSPENQRERIADICNAHELPEPNGRVFEEIDVSGARTLERRTGLKRIVELAEAGKITHAIFPYFDRLARNQKVYMEAVDRIEAAGVIIIAGDLGVITRKTSGGRLVSGIKSLVDEDFVQRISEGTIDGHTSAIAAGHAPLIPPGLRKREDGTLEPDENADVIREAFNLAGAGRSTADIQRYLADHGVERCRSAVYQMLRNEIYIGVLRFGRHVNKRACEPLVKRELFNRIQRRTNPAGRKSKSPQLLSRLGILRCGTCGARMVAGAHMNRPDQAFYRCHDHGCSKHQVIMAHTVDEYAKRNCIQVNADVVGRATADQKYRTAKQQLQKAQDAFSGLVAMLTGMESEPDVVERLRVAREARDAAQAEVDRLEPAQTSVLLTSDALWESATVDERRQMLSATFESITVGAGRGESRLSFELRV